MNRIKSFGTAIFCLFIALSSTREAAFCQSNDSILLPPSAVPLPAESELAKLALKQRWQIAIHGIRLAPLDPKVWGILKRDRTDNRQLVPMRPLILRSSEDPNFRIRSIEIDFQFRAVTDSYMRRVPHMKDSILDISFAGEYIPQKSNELGGTDRTSLLRLSAFPDILNGIYYRERSLLALLKSFEPATLKTAEQYSISLLFSSNSVNVKLNGEEVATLNQADIDHGLIALTTGWNPLNISKLLLRGVIQNKGKLQTIEESGLISYDALNLQAKHTN